LKEAVARAGRAERLLSHERESASARDCWIRQAKVDAGYQQNTSFDVVWEHALAALKDKQASEEH
jgi:hypothetical protein